MKQSRYIRVQISAVVRVKEPRPLVGVSECAEKAMLDAVESFAKKAIKDAEYIMPGAKLTVTFAKDLK